MQMKKLNNILFSMPTMGFLMLLFAVSAGVATIIENDFGTSASKAMVYNAMWFNILLLLLGLNLIANIIRFKMWKLKKLPIFLFHISFIVILLGSAITRFISYEGTMHIREGATSSTMLSDRAFVDIKILDNGDEVSESQAILLSVLNRESYSESVSINNKKFKFNSVNYIPNAREIIKETDGEGDPYIILVSSQGMSGRQTYYLKYNEKKQIGSYLLNFGEEEIENAINIKFKDGNLFVNPPDTITTVSMSGAKNDTLLSNNWSNFSQGFLYRIKDLNIVLSNSYKNGIIDYAPYEGNDVSMMDALVIDVVSGDETKTITVRGGKGYKGAPSVFEINNAEIVITYGSKEINLPFSIKVLDFQLDRYPGSMSPSSYSSDVLLIDEEKGIREEHRIYMNNVLNHRGFRFFQSSYDGDEKGTILSVNHDFWGTSVTYLGYLLMTLGMVLVLFFKSTRFAKLGESIKGSAKISNTISAIIISVLFISGSQVAAQHGSEFFNADDLPVIEKQHAGEFGKLMVQSQDGRLKPVNTLSSEVMRKITGGKSSMFGMNSDQMFLGMMSSPLYWQQAPIIKIKHDRIKEMLGIEGKYASYLDFIDMTKGTYKLSDVVNTAYSKMPAKRGTFDKDLIAADERLNVIYMVFKGSFLRLLPDPNDPMVAWYSPESHLHGLAEADSSFIASVIPSYLNSLKNGNVELSEQLLRGIGDYQKKFGASIMPSQSRVDLEIRYNKMNIFNRLGSFYGLLGLIMIILSFVTIFNPSKVVGIVLKIMLVLVAIAFLLQTGGLAMRWYISGHAPWSDGYESMIYIAWVTVLAGLTFARKSNMTLAATTILASVILMVAHLSWMNPEITNLVPVLKSYWLTIHVSVITASYGFLALSMLLGFINMILMIFRKSSNLKKMNTNIDEISAISERSMTVGLYMLTIGTFLGGVWANESWGRYWGWDPKETWALVSVLFYAFILHMRFIPGLRGKFSFSFASVIGYFSILMTYFGVNYYLAGLHSYASGDPMPIPTFVYYSIAVIILVAIFAYLNEQKFLALKSKK